MSSALPYLLIGLVVATLLSAVALTRERLRRPRSPVRTVDDFHAALRAIAPERARRKRARTRWPA